jgi:hypothetical protein
VRVNTRPPSLAVLSIFRSTMLARMLLHLTMI